jgi:fumarate reductase flavoprotein subunit
MSPEAGIENPPPPVPPEDIRETVEADVIVVGAGISGLTAALSAAEAGARTILLEKSPGCNYRGLQNAAISSRLQKQAGIEIDRDQLIATIMEWGAYRADQKIIRKWADNCDAVIDWLMDMAEAAGIEVQFDPTTKPWYFPNYPVIHVFAPDFQETLAGMLLENGRARGVDYRFEMPVVRLVREGKGRVTGVIAQNTAGEYIGFNSRRAVVLCTGDYGNNREMVEKYCWPSINSLACAYLPAVNTGDGHRMGMWIGADIDDPPHCVMLFDSQVRKRAQDSRTFYPREVLHNRSRHPREALFNLPRQPWLHVNINGERFMNEDLPWGYECNQVTRQPGSIAWAVWDGKYDQEWPKMHSQCCKNMGPPTYLWDPKQLETAIERGYVLTAGTLEELAAKIEVPVETFRATVARYNELARQGRDLDFGKHPDRLTTIEKPLFYACKIGGCYLIILGGLKINEDLQVLDTERKPIPGLYAAGNVSGSFFGNMYPTTVPGLSHSRAWTFGRLAGLNAAGEKPWF